MTENKRVSIPTRPFGVLTAIAANLSTYWVLLENRNKGMFTEKRPGFCNCESSPPDAESKTVQSRNRTPNEVMIPVFSCDDRVLTSMDWDVKWSQRRLALIIHPWRFYCQWRDLTIYANCRYRKLRQSGIRKKFYR